VQIRILMFLNILFILSCLSCKENIIQKKNENTPIETFNFTEYENRINNDPLNGHSYIKSDGTLIEEIVVGNKKRVVRWETPPKPSFAKIYKEFYPNGNIKSIEMFFGKYTKIGTSLFFNKKGKLKKQIDENKKFDKIKPEDILLFLKEKNRISIETNEGIFDENGNELFEISYNNKKNIWYVTIKKGRLFTDSEMLEIMSKIRGEPGEWKPFEYMIDGKTGEIIKSEE